MMIWCFTDFCEGNSHHARTKARTAMNNSITSITWHAKQRMKMNFGWRQDLKKNIKNIQNRRKGYFKNKFYTLKFFFTNLDIESDLKIVEKS